MVEFYKSKDKGKQCYRWRVRDKDRKIIGRSEEAFLRGSIPHVVKAVGKAARRDCFEYYVDKTGHWRWRCIAANREVIAISPGGLAIVQDAKKQTREFKRIASGRKVCK